MNIKKDIYNVLFDSTILCSISYGILYFFAYLHEKYFLKEFGIHIDFIEINNINVIINLIPIIISWASSLLVLYFMKRSCKNNLPLLLEKWFLLFMPCIFLSMICNDNNFQYYGFLLIFIIVGVLIIIRHPQPQIKFISFSKIMYILHKKPRFYFFIVFTIFFKFIIENVNIEKYRFAIVSENIINNEKIYKDIVLKRYNSFFIIKTFDVKNKKFCDGFKIINADTYDNLNILYYQRGKDLWKITYK